MSDFSVPPEIEEKFEIIEMIGKGGFSRVYKAIQRDLQRTVALKTLNLFDSDDAPQLEESEDVTLTRFLREAQMLSRLSCQYTVTVYEFGVFDESAYISMEYVDGDNLASILDQEGAFSTGRVTQILEHMLHCLHEAHEMGLVHRDIKPQNIMLCQGVAGEEVRLLDFGIVKIVSAMQEDREVEELTNMNVLLGTPRYMAPEYIGGAEHTQCSDLYSLGIVLYRLLTGEHAIPSNTTIQIISKHLDPESFQIEKNGDAAHDSLVDVINKMLQKAPEDRYQTAKQVLDDLSKRKEELLKEEISQEIAKTIDDEISTRLDKALYKKKEEKRSNLMYLIAALIVGVVGVWIYNNMGGEQAKKIANIAEVSAAENHPREIAREDTKPARHVENEKPILLTEVEPLDEPKELNSEPKSPDMNVDLELTSSASPSVENIEKKAHRGAEKTKQISPRRFNYAKKKTKTKPSEPTPAPTNDVVEEPEPPTPKVAPPKPRTKVAPLGGGLAPVK